MSNSAFIDHQLVTNEMVPAYVANSAEAFRPQITNYKTTTSDHYPIISRFDFGQVAATLKLLSPNGGEVVTAGSNADITWQSTGVANVSVDYSPDEFTWYSVTASTPAASGRLTVQLPTQTTNTGRVRVSDASNPDLFDVSDGTFSIVRPTPTVFINEVLAHEPPTSTGTRDFAQEFVEVVNSGTTTVDLSGWKVNDKRAFDGLATTRHLFASGTLLAPGKAIVVFSGASAVPSGMTNAVVAAPGPLFLDNGPVGDAVYLQDGSGQLIDVCDFLNTTTVEAVSFNRSPDGAATGSFVLHNTLPSGTNASPGKRANGAAF